jgi:transposase InsO family protein
VSRHLEQALRHGQPEIFNTDQGAQFISPAFTERLQKGGVRISMDGRGRALDNMFVERLWRSVKYEDVYVRDVSVHLGYRGTRQDACPGSGHPGLEGRMEQAPRRALPHRRL